MSREKPEGALGKPSLGRARLPGLSVGRIRAIPLIPSVRIDLGRPLLVLVRRGMLVFSSACSFLGLGRLAPCPRSLLVRRCALLLGPVAPSLRLFPVLSCFYAPLLETLSPEARYCHQEDDDQDGGDYRDYNARAHCTPIWRIYVTSATYSRTRNTARIRLQ